MANLGNTVVNKVELYGANNDGNPISYTVADGTQISKGIIVALNDPRTVVKNTAASASAAVVVAGITAAEKEANDGSTNLAVWTNGIFDIKASGAITVGDPVVAVQDNFVMALAAGSSAASGALILGYALETAADQEIIEVRVNK